MSIKLIVSDIDGCLGPGKKKALDLNWWNKVADYNVEAKEKGNPMITLCTGRSQPFVEAALLLVGSNLPAICEHGAYIYDPVKDMIFMNPKVTEEIIDAKRELKLKLQKEYFKKWNIRNEVCKEICISLVPNGDMTCEELHKLAEEVVPGDIFKMVHNKEAVDIIPKELDKGSGIRFLSEYMGISLDEMAGIGDSAGDVPFLKLVNYSACPSNASPEIKGISDYISEFTCTQGVWDIVCHLQEKKYNDKLELADF